MNALTEEQNFKQHIAVMTNFPAIAKYLIDEGVNTDQRNKQGKTAAELAHSPEMEELFKSNAQA